MPITAVIFDVDGTLVDSNDAHAQAWVQAFQEARVPVDPIRVRRSIGMGGDKLMPAVSPLSAESDEGRRISERRAEIFRGTYLPSLRAFPGAGRLVETLKTRGFTLSVASSAKEDEVRELLEIADAAVLLPAATSSDDVDESKPEPDVVVAALRKIGETAENAVMIGDTPYDVAAASAAGVPCIAFRCGGWTDAELTGAAEVYDGPADLLARLDRSALLAR
jgi:phosphoglycolate phosphatase-like HAD superfamily hydrolase